ncbi:MAG TPA: hypothetical protein VM325_17145 [Alphaproteobacteria bacterium]|nr:hypothetical protein [Alphaproteobacteria bacterium]
MIGRRDVKAKAVTAQPADRGAGEPILEEAAAPGECQPSPGYSLNDVSFLGVAAAREIEAKSQRASGAPSREL